MLDKEKIKIAALRMDPDKESQWTAAGEANLTSLQFLAGEKVSRDELNEALPGFNRESLRKYLADLQATGGNNVNQTKGSGSGNGVTKVVPQQPKVEGPGSESGAPDIEALAEKVNRANEAVLECERLQEEARLNLQSAIEKRDAAVQALEAVKPKATFAQTNAAFLASQRANYRRRAEAVAVVRTSGINLRAVAEAIGPSKLDRALGDRRRKP